MLAATAADHKTAAPEFVGQIKSGEYKVANPSTTELQVNVYGETAVATRIFWKASETIKNEKSAGRYRFTGTRAKRDSRWQGSPRRACQSSEVVAYHVLRPPVWSAPSGGFFFRRAR